jgi:ElaB/YqjD/DUF883 family membrane-anchored ribosome-binding protein
MDAIMEDRKMNAKSSTIERVKEGVEDVVEKTRDAVNDGLDAAKDRFQYAAKHFDKRYRKTARGLRNRALAVRDTLVDTKKSLAGGYAQASKKMVKIDRDTRKYVTSNPRKALLIAAGVGLLAGLVLTRSRRAPAED